MVILAKFILILTLSFNAFSHITEVVILQTTDIHAHISYAGSKQKSGDWLRLATAIKLERRKAGGRSKCLLIDCGDTIQGTLMGALSRGEVSILMLDALQYDAWILGNHELDLGVARLRELTGKCKTPVINGNLRLMEFPKIPPYRLYNKSKAKIAVIGMNASLLDFWLWGKRMRGFEVRKAVPSIEKVFPEVMAHNPDMIIVALHQGLMEHDPRNVNEV